jgi:hypothetical protein
MPSTRAAQRIYLGFEDSDRLRTLACVDNAAVQMHLRYMNKRQNYGRLGTGPQDDLLDQLVIYVDAEAFRKILDWMEKPATAQEVAGMKKLFASSARR